MKQGYQPAFELKSIKKRTIVNFLSSFTYLITFGQSAPHEEIHIIDAIRFRFSWLRSEVSPADKAAAKPADKAAAKPADKAAAKPADKAAAKPADKAAAKPADKAAAKPADKAAAKLAAPSAVTGLPAPVTSKPFADAEKTASGSLRKYSRRVLEPKSL